METTLLKLPTGTVLEPEIEEIEAAAHDERIRQIIMARMAAANAPDAVFRGSRGCFYSVPSQTHGKTAATGCARLV